jgi:hypothetical protein
MRARIHHNPSACCCFPNFGRPADFHTNRDKHSNTSSIRNTIVYPRAAH